MKYLTLALTFFIVSQFTMQSSQAQEGKFSINLNLFVEPGNSYCDDAKRVAMQRAKKNGVQLKILDVSDPANKAYRDKLADFYKVPKVVPFVFGCNKIVYGYEEGKFDNLLRDMMKIQIFTGDGCGPCIEAKALLEEWFEKKYPGFEVDHFNLDQQDFANRWLGNNWDKLQYDSSQKGKNAKPPAFYFCDKIYSYTNSEEMKSRIDKDLRRWTVKMTR